jgi:hypothetical protein
LETDSDTDEYEEKTFMKRNICPWESLLVFILTTNLEIKHVLALIRAQA